MVDTMVYNTVVINAVKRIADSIDVRRCPGPLQSPIVLFIFRVNILKCIN